MPRPPHGARAMTNDERQALRRLRYREMREEIERLRAELAEAHHAVRVFAGHIVAGRDDLRRAGAVSAKLDDHSNDPGVRAEAIKMGAKG